MLADLLRRSYDDMCFACGRDNPMGIAIRDFDVSGDRVTAWFRPRPEHRGAPGVLHGGVSAAAVDEIAVWAGIVFAGVVTVTGTLDLRYRRPVPIDADLRLEGFLVRQTGRRLELGGRLLVDGREAVTGSGLYLASTPLADLGISWDPNDIAGR